MRRPRTKFRELLPLLSELFMLLVAILVGGYLVWLVASDSNEVARNKRKRVPAKEAPSIGGSRFI